MASLSADDLRTLTRRDLQGLAKSHSLKANGSSNKIIEALCDRFPDGVPSLKRGASPTTTTSRAGAARTDRRLSRHAKPRSPLREIVAHERTRTSLSPSSPPRNAPASLSKSDTERLVAPEDAEPNALADHKPLQRENALVLEESAELLSRMMVELQEARARQQQLELENAALRGNASTSLTENALQLGEEPSTEPSSSQATETIASPAILHTNATAQPMTPSSLQQPHARLPPDNHKSVQTPDDMPIEMPVDQDLNTVSSTPRSRPPSPLGLSGMSLIHEKLEFMNVAHQMTTAQINLELAELKIEMAWLEPKTSSDQMERLQRRREIAEDAVLNAIQMEANDSDAAVLIGAKNTVETMRDEQRRYQGELDWTLGLGTYPPQELSAMEQENTIRFRNWAVHKDEITLPMVLGPEALAQDAESEYEPPEHEHEHEGYDAEHEDFDAEDEGEGEGEGEGEDYDATSDFTPSELEDVEMRDMDLSVEEDDITMGVDGVGVDALLSEMAKILRGEAPRHTLHPTRATIPDPQGFVKLPQGRERKPCWVPVKHTERVWEKCDQAVCTHGLESGALERQQGGDMHGTAGQATIPEGLCHPFDDLPEVEGRPKPKGRWVEKPVDLLEGGKYLPTCVIDVRWREGDVAVPGWSLRLEGVPIWEH
ncbi:hypothetical protein PENSPDRAFT_732571 [Peniophora sp. CONT]|nr:hypothetical protein PENSPDRAFT_732571 [Peniophora sp. CONT]